MSTKQIATGVGGLVVLIAVVSGAYYWHNHRNTPASPQTQTQPTRYQIQNSYYTSSATPAGQRVSFKKPAELIPVTTSYTNEITLAQTQNNAYNAYIAEDFVASQPTLSPQQLSAALADTSSSAYQSSLAGVKAFISRRFISAYSINYQKAKTFSNSSIKSNTWQLDFAAINKTSHKIYDGRAVYAISNQGQYYFAIVAPDYNWQNNINTWNQVFDSLNIDQ